MHCSTRMIIVPSITRVSAKILNQMLLEVLMNCTKHFDMSSSLAAICVARFMIC